MANAAENERIHDVWTLIMLLIDGGIIVFTGIASTTATATPQGPRDLNWSRVSRAQLRDSYPHLNFLPFRNRVHFHPVISILELKQGVSTRHYMAEMNENGSHTRLLWRRHSAAPRGGACAREGVPDEILIREEIPLSLQSRRSLLTLGAGSLSLTRQSAQLLAVLSIRRCELW